MNRTEDSVEVQTGQMEQWHVRLLVPVAIAAVAITAVLLLVVTASRSAWFLLGAGRGVVPEEYYHVSGFVVVFGTLLGQAAGWAGGSAIGYYVLTLIGFGRTWTTARIAMSLVYLGLAGLPLAVYHALYGQWLLGIPREGLEEWLGAQYPDAYWLLIKLHPVVDLSLIPLGVIALGILWAFGERVRWHMGLQTVFWLALFGTSLAVALSLGIHSTLVHIRL